MKSLPLNSDAYAMLLMEYRQWLELLGYADNTVYYLSNHVQEFLHFQEQHKKLKIQEISQQQIEAYIYYLQHRKNERQEGGLSNAYLKKQKQAILLLTQYLRQQYKIQIPASFILIDSDEHVPDVLTLDELKQLYNTARELSYRTVPDNVPYWMPHALYLRDKAMLGIYYGCGLRRNEGVHLDKSDINYHNKTIKVRKGKNYKQRIVPVSQKVMDDLELYQYDARPLLQRNKEIKPTAFLLSQRGGRIGGQMLLLRLQQLIAHSGNTALQQKKVGLHTLRHSIATHLLQNGMPIEQIAQLLGHSSLESTQLYTHIISQYEQGNSISIIPP